MNFGGGLASLRTVGYKNGGASLGTFSSKDFFSSSTSSKVNSLSSFLSYYTCNIFSQSTENSTSLWELSAFSACQAEKFLSP